MTHFWLHVGPHKTGSSYLQTGLFQNAAALRRCGVVLPSFWNDTPQNPSHTGLVARLMPAGLPELRPIFEGWIDSAVPAVLITSEDLSTIGAEPLRLLKSLTGEQPVTVLYYVRRWSELIVSAWQQWVMGGFTLPLTEVLLHNFKNTAMSQNLNLGLRLRDFDAIFGRASIKLIAYNQVLAAGLDIFEHLTRQVLGLEPALPRPARRVNVSLAPEKTELLRLFNVLDESEGFVPDGRLRRYLELEHGPAPARHLLAVLAGYSKTLKLHDDETPVREILRQDRQDFAANLLPPFGADHIYAPKINDVTLIRPDYALVPGFAEAVRGLRRDLLAIDGGRPVRETRL